MLNHKKPPFINVYAVRTGKAYSMLYVERLIAMLCKHMHVPFQFSLLTDQPEKARCDDPQCTVANYHLPDLNIHLQGWWAKMAVFWLAGIETRPGLYFDLDTVIIRDLWPLIQLAPKYDFMISHNFTRVHQLENTGSATWPCRYGSCLMTFGGSDRYRQLYSDIWIQFRERQRVIIDDCGNKGDQFAIQQIHPTANILQDHLPADFIVGRRDFTPTPAPEPTAVMVFAGSHKPHNTPHKWLKEAWKCQK